MRGQKLIMDTASSSALAKEAKKEKPTETIPPLTCGGPAPAPLPPNEETRIAKLMGYEILDTSNDPMLDRLTEIAAMVCETPIALISLVDKERQWFKSAYGLPVKETPRDVSVCAHAILDPEKPFIVGDLSKDPRFATNPLVTGEPYIRFYAGIPLVDREKIPLGTFCVIDRKPKELSELQIAMLRKLSEVAINRIMDYRSNTRLTRLLHLEKEVYNRLLHSSSELSSTATDFDTALSYLINNLDVNLGWLSARILNMQSGGSTGILYNTAIPSDPDLPALWQKIDTLPAHPHTIGSKTEFISAGSDKNEFSYMVVPVAIRDRLVAIIELVFPDHRQIDPRIEEVFDMMASNLGIIAERELVAIELRHQATHDQLTGAANRTVILRSIQEAILECDALEPDSVVLFFDMDGFKDVNDNFGHETGDRLLKEITARLMTVCRSNDMLGRLSGDEFILLARGIEIESGIAPLLERIARTLDNSFMLGELEIRVEASIGAAIIDNPDITANELIRRAEEAMYMVKRGERKGFCIADEEVIRDFQIRRNLDHKVKDAFRHNRFLLHFQPIVELSTGRVSGSEALARLLRKDGSIMPASEFIQAIERVRYLSQLDEWALAEMLRLTATPFCQSMLSEHGCRMSVNISPPILSTKGYAEKCLGQLRNAGFPPESLTLEIIESSMLQPHKLVIENLSELRKGGVKIALDDFGTGYSNLLQVSKLPVDIIKIDKEFISGITPGPSKSNELLTAMVGIGKSLGFLIVAEGVETEQQADFLKLIGCTHAQGYLYGKPMPLEAMKKLMMEKQSATALPHS